MSEQPSLGRVLDRELREIAEAARRTLTLLQVSDRIPDSARYLAVVRGVRLLEGMWTRHIHTEQALLPYVLSFDAHFAPYLDRIGVENEAIEEHLASIIAAPWPRSTHAGLHSIRMRVTRVLTQLLLQVDRERVTLLPVMRRWLPEIPGEAAEPANAVHLAVR